MIRRFFSPTLQSCDGLYLNLGTQWQCSHLVGRLGGHADAGDAAAAREELGIDLVEPGSAGEILEEHPDLDNVSGAGVAGSAWGREIMRKDALIAFANFIFAPVRQKAVHAGGLIFFSPTVLLEGLGQGCQGFPSLSLKIRGLQRLNLSNLSGQEEQPVVQEPGRAEREAFEGVYELDGSLGATADWLEKGKTASFHSLLIYLSN